MFPSELIQNLPENKWHALRILLDKWDTAKQSGSISSQEILFGYRVVRHILGNESIVGQLSDPKDPEAGNFRSNVDNDFSKILSLVNQQIGQMTVEDIDEQVETILKSRRLYEFHEDELKEVQARINELRTALTALSEISEDHRQRMLSRLEALQRELHKRMSTLDKFLGFFWDVALTTRQIHENVEGIMGPASAIFEIVMRVAEAKDGNMVQEFMRPMLPSSGDVNTGE